MAYWRVTYKKEEGGAAKDYNSKEYTVDMFGNRDFLMVVKKDDDTMSFIAKDAIMRLDHFVSDEAWETNMYGCNITAKCIKCNEEKTLRQNNWRGRDECKCGGIFLIRNE